MSRTVNYIYNSCNSIIIPTNQKSRIVTINRDVFQIRSSSLVYYKWIKYFDFRNLLDWWFLFYATIHALDTAKL